jgi:DNA-binding CsgD family transcriptional regulator/tetratricopeptide (TPR) repeat protein
MSFISAIGHPPAKGCLTAAGAGHAGYIRPAIRVVARGGLTAELEPRKLANLLERDAPLKTLAEAVRETAAGSGRIVLVCGEAGIGKTALVERFLSLHRGDARVLLGRCDALSTPEPLGPLHEIARQMGGALCEFIHGADRRLAIFSSLLCALQKSEKPSVLIFEDVHWADAVTLDLLKYLGRRIRNANVLLILTYRDDELDRSHALWSALGSLPSDAVKRVALEPLTEVAVARLANQAGKSAERLHARTGGNPFYVTELLASPSGSVPASVREATLARATRLSPEARALLDLCAVVPNRIERRLLSGPAGAMALISECIATGLLIDEGESLKFRHELARQAIESALPRSSLQELHGTVLRGLLTSDAENVARIVHHAASAGDRAVVGLYAPEAARQASALGAHRESAAHYATALDHTPASDVEMRATLLEARSRECYLIDQVGTAISLCEMALELRRRQGDRLRAGDDLRWLSRFNWFCGRGESARNLAMEAIELLEQLPPGPELAMAYSTIVQLNMLSEDYPEAVQWGNRALDLAERFGFTEVHVHALNNVGTAEFYLGEPGGAAKLERSLELALAHEMHDHAARAYSNLICDALMVRDYAIAQARLAEGLAYTRERDLDRATLYQLAMRARAQLEQGLWQEADDDAKTALAAGQTVARIDATVVLGCVRLRRGDPSARMLLDEARDLALAAGEIQRIAPMAAVRAEAAWLQDDKGRIRKELEAAYELALKHPEPWRLGELSLWLWRAGVLEVPPEGIAEPYRLEISGNWQAAAAVWQQIGCPYEQALALASGDQPAQLRALKILTKLGAVPAAQIVRRILHAGGIRGIPRGPSSGTRGNPFGLTARQHDILGLLAGNLSSKEIAAKLRISPRTVDHHVFAILGKLGVPNRKDAASRHSQLACEI